ncbi:MAG TPA: class I SAM-dependent methyltransferase [Symbiobacteriaceae bacterium]|nr:class I SAM-dependent methyltransferase [Symbiobacteriaceae bacterium]
MTRWNAVYTRKKHVYGKHGNGLLWQYLHDAPEGPVLDVGCGEGRNGLMAARMGHEVLGLDISAVAVERANQSAIDVGLPFEAWVANMMHYEYPERTYSAVIAALVLPFVRKSQVVPLLEEFRRATVQGGLFYASALRVDDPDAQAHIGFYPEVEPGCFWKPQLEEHRSFFDTGELRRMCEAAGYQIVEYLEGVFLEEPDGEKPHYHRQVQVVARVP